MQWFNASLTYFVKPPPPIGTSGGYMFSGRPSVPLSVRPCVHDSRGSFMFPRYLQYLLTDFRQTFVTVASRYRDELIRFWGQKVKFWFKVTPSRRRCTALDGRHSTLPSSATFSSLSLLLCSRLYRKLCYAFLHVRQSVSCFCLSQ